MLTRKLLCLIYSLQAYRANLIFIFTINSREPIHFFEQQFCGSVLPPVLRYSEEVFVSRAECENVEEGRHFYCHHVDLLENIKQSENYSKVYNNQESFHRQVPSELHTKIIPCQQTPKRQCILEKSKYKSCSEHYILKQE